MGLSDIIILYIGKTNQISPLLTITSIIKTDRVGSENVYTQALWNQRLWEPYSDILKLLFYYFDTHKNLVIEWGNIAWWGRGGLPFFYSYQWQLEVTVLQNYVSSSSNSSWYSKSSRIMYLTSPVNGGELTSSSFVWPLLNFSYLWLETNILLRHDKVTSWYGVQWVFSYLWVKIRGSCMLICSQCTPKVTQMHNSKFTTISRKWNFLWHYRFGYPSFFFWNLLDVNEPINLCTCNYWYRITNVTALFSIAIVTTGNGANTLFWKYNWLHNNLIANLAAHLFALIPKRWANKLYSEGGEQWMSLHGFKI